MSNINVQIIADFPEADGYPAFRDAIYVSLDEYQTMSEAEIEAARVARYDAWKQVIDDAANAPAPEEPVAQPVSSVDQARQILTDALAQLDALPPEQE